MKIYNGFPGIHHLQTGRASVAGTAAQRRPLDPGSEASLAKVAFDGGNRTPGIHAVTETSTSPAGPGTWDDMIGRERVKAKQAALKDGMMRIPQRKVGLVEIDTFLLASSVTLHLTQTCGPPRQMRSQHDPRHFAVLVPGQVKIALLRQNNSIV